MLIYDIYRLRKLRYKCPIDFIYYINSNVLQPAGDSDPDLGFYFRSSLSLHILIKDIYNKVLKMLEGFIKKVTIELNLKNPLKSLYFLFSGPILKYGTMV